MGLDSIDMMVHGPRYNATSSVAQRAWHARGTRVAFVPTGSRPGPVAPARAAAHSQPSYMAPVRAALVRRAALVWLTGKALEWLTKLLYT